MIKFVFVSDNVVVNIDRITIARYLPEYTVALGDNGMAGDRVRSSIAISFTANDDAPQVFYGEEADKLWERIHP